MRIMLLGAGGFIGRHILAELLSVGHQVVAIVRGKAELAEAFPEADFLQLDLTGATDQIAWIERLKEIDCIVNSAGLLRGAQLDAIHVTMPRALYAAASQVGVKHVVLISAISARPDVATDYSVSKIAGEQVLRKSGLAWTILRPSLVYGDGSYGGTSLLRGLAALPLTVPLPGQGEFEFTPLHARDLAKSVSTICGNNRFFNRSLEPVGPETLSLREILARYRTWLGFGRARFTSIPMPLMRLLARMGDVLGDGPVSTNSLSQMVANNAGDSAAYAAAIGFVPRRLGDALLARPAQVQDRWHARLYFLAPAIRAVLVVLWLASAWLGLFNGDATARAVTAGLGLSEGWADPLRVFGSVLDIAVAALVLLDRNARVSTAVQLLVVMGYTLVIGYALPMLWLDPFGPLLKNFPILLLIAVHGAIGNKR